MVCLTCGTLAAARTRVQKLTVRHGVARASATRFVAHSRVVGAEFGCPQSFLDADKDRVCIGVAEGRPRDGEGKFFPSRWCDNNDPIRSGLRRAAEIVLFDNCPNSYNPRQTDSVRVPARVPASCDTAHPRLCSKTCRTMTASVTRVTPPAAATTVTTAVTPLRARTGSLTCRGSPQRKCPRLWNAMMP